MKLTPCGFVSGATEQEVLAVLKQRSVHGGAWVASVLPFSDTVHLYCFANPSSVPDFFADTGMCFGSGSVRVAYKGKIRGLTQAALIREQNRGLGCE